MKQEQLLKVQSLLRDWLNERHLDIYMQNANLEANLLEEVTEYLRAKDDIERIDALCDIIVFSLNSLDEDIDLSLDTSIPNTHRGMRNIVIDIADFIRDKDGNRVLTPFREKQAIVRIVKRVCKMIEELGYSPYECLLETIKEISSRKGEYNDTIKKFVKYQGAYNDFEANDIVKKLSLEAPFKIIKEDNEYWYYGIESIVQGQLVKWYRADYSKCKK